MIIKANYQWIFIGTSAQRTIFPKKETRNNVFYFYANETEKEEN